ncbi:MAG: glycosyltransferase [Actinomycetales bacterium]|nr:glycosyltransferase [Actinomycetales bacterium]
MTAEVIRSRKGRTLTVVGDPALLTMDRLGEFTSRIDSDPRIASLSLVPGPSRSGSWLRAAAPAGALIAVAADLDDLVGAFDPDAEDGLENWARRASERGLWHDWWITSDADVLRAEGHRHAAEVDAREADDPSSSRHFAMRAYSPKPGRLTVTVDVTWLGPFETGAQVLTTAALGALAEQEDVTEIRLVGLDELPEYAAHLADRERIRLLGPEEDAPRSDVVWYPNQIDGRSNIAAARRLGARVVTTYLDLIAYDIPRYHGSPEAWHAYRALQRRIALSVDGITTISADVAARLLEEVPRLDPERVLALPLGLDHVSVELAPEEPGEDLAELVKSLGGKRFVAVLGNDFQHKNRDFAIKVWEAALQAGQPCDLVLAGLHVKSSSSKEQEDDLIARHLDLRGRIHTVGHVSSQSRAWLLAHATVVLYPTSAEGFGFVPYEAASLGTPTVFTDFGPLREIAGISGMPRGWSVDDYAADLVALLSDEALREARVEALEEALDTYTWRGFAGELTRFFGRIIHMPEVPTSAVGADTAAADAAALSAVLSSRSYRAAQKLRRVFRR